MNARPWLRWEHSGPHWWILRLGPVRCESWPFGFCAPHIHRCLTLRLGRTLVKVGVFGNFWPDRFYFARYRGPIFWLALFRGLVFFGLVHYRKGELLVW